MLSLSQNQWNNLRFTKVRGLEDLEKLGIRLTYEKIVDYEMNRFESSLEFSIITCDEFYDRVRDFVYEFSDFETSWLYMDHEATLISLAIYDTIGFGGKIFKDIRNIIDYFPIMYSIDEDSGFMSVLIDRITEKYRTYQSDKGFRILDEPKEESMEHQIWKLLDKVGYFERRYEYEY